MDTELKAKWVEALRSGKFGQCRGSLRDNDGYCCLGVFYTAVLGNELTKLSNCSPEIGEIYDAIESHVPAANALTRMNDFDRKSFPEIADYIEANL